MTVIEIIPSPTDEAIAEIDALLASVNTRHLIPATEFVDRLLDVRNNLSEARKAES